MNLKLFEILDRGTFIEAFAFRPVPSNFGPTSQLDAERYLFRRNGWTDAEQSMRSLIFGRLDGECHNDPYEWRGSSRTMPQAHLYIAEHFNELESGSVVDIEFILGEVTAPKQSERLTVVA